MKDSLLHRLETLRTRLIELDHCLQAPDVTQQLDQYRKLTRERAELVPVVELYDAYRHTLADMEAAATLGQEDPEWRHFADEETEQGKRRLEQLEAAIQTALLPRDPNDGRNIFLEIRAGTGGDESALFAGDLFRMYSRFSERLGWRTEIISHNPGEMGGFKEIIFRIEGAGAYSRFKFESGGHRVQRVPATETQGRIHTSACTVAVLPEADEVGEIALNPADLRIDTFRASGAGGQHINKTDSAVRITHLPTGLVVECQDGRSQHKNKAQALAVLAARLRDKQEREQHAQVAATRRSLIGSGDRSERIRTYNFPQGRITDHRINLTLYKIEALMDGDLFELTETLMTEHQADLLAGLAEPSE
ncbi:peptide chain release factor 1 [mine drainage metagenome]|uniref:Peptide chain release factor 1 n=1 Tax=mine drainage metagenome TaxID=410659 RepID=T1D5T4_9ZZZZ|nr:peptide chain release factor 1 [Ferrovum myxofaciens]